MVELSLSEESIDYLRSFVAGISDSNEVTNYFKDKFERESKPSLSIPFLLKFKTMYKDDIRLLELCKGFDYVFPVKPKVNEEAVTEMRNRCHEILYRRLVQNVSPETHRRVDIARELQSSKKIFMLAFNAFAVIISSGLLGFYLSDYLTRNYAYRIVSGVIVSVCITIIEYYFVLKYDTS